MFAYHNPRIRITHWPIFKFSESPSGATGKLVALILITARILREGLLQQDAFSEVDSYNCKEKQVALLRVMLRFHNEAEKALKRNISIEKISSMKLISELIRLKETYRNNQVKEILKWEEKIKSFFEKICEE